MVDSDRCSLADSLVNGSSARWADVGTDWRCSVTVRVFYTRDRRRRTARAPTSAARQRYGNETRRLASQDRTATIGTSLDLGHRIVWRDLSEVSRNEAFKKFEAHRALVTWCLTGRHPADVWPGTMLFRGTLHNAYKNTLHMYNYINFLISRILITCDPYDLICINRPTK